MSSAFICAFFMYGNTSNHFLNYLLWLYTFIYIFVCELYFYQYVAISLGLKIC